MHTILLIEDDQEINQMVADYLRNEGFEVKVAFDGEEAMTLFNEGEIDLVLLDLMLPKLDGMSVMKRMRQQAMTPIVIISAKDTDTDKALGLGFGADDYLAKPFSLIELSARVKANIRRATQYIVVNQEKQEDVITYKDLEINLNQFSVTKKGKEIKLTMKEYEILRLLATHINQVFTKSQIYNAVWKEDYYGDENLINVHIRRLREKIEDDPSEPEYIETLWGIGYKMGDN